MSWKSTAHRWMFNFFPVFRNTGARITHMSEDQRLIRLKLPLRRSTKNYVGTIYGGSMYSALDGLLMVMFIRLLGKEYIVWDKAGRIEYLMPGREDLYADVEIATEELEFIRNTLREQRKLEKEYTLEWKTKDGELVCRVHKLLYFRKRAAKSD